MDFYLIEQFHLANQMKSSSQVVKGRYGMQAVKPVNNDTIKREMKRKQNLWLTPLLHGVYVYRYRKPCSYGKLNKYGARTLISYPVICRLFVQYVLYIIDS